MTSTVDEAGPLDNVTLEGGVFVIDGAVDPVTESEDVRAGRERFEAVVTRLVSEDRLHGFVRWFYGWAGRRLEVEALEIGEDDKEFREACNLLYRDIKDGVLGPWIDTAPLETLERVLVYGWGFGLPFYQAAMEIKARKPVEANDDTPEPAVAVETVEVEENE